ncbi:hypothetical protein BLNAU_7200 [Blattamonas nauphoetae]|uniref:Uncharacterized protein n=1 Tax=Blattamonas nauphoetae TaxID=2049346 RepID=A0ABQ9WML8_9EUKA|nr:hypothetical protein BLNAU_24517 [Blattamonas nauphoetae]KAK2941096.1 hypothetical protein BLNAU_23987 [Blattamonas nauphoetae]KAK2942147.1 hypothetical protein BLNAU_22943 [Blattamonas nauphoetae]KAK2957766.1 hypothetical protein BLNAU_7200 [Blattamonas nauphoetae]
MAVLDVSDPVALVMRVAVDAVDVDVGGPLINASVSSEDDEGEEVVEKDVNETFPTLRRVHAEEEDMETRVVGRVSVKEQELKVTSPTEIEGEAMPIAGDKNERPVPRSWLVLKVPIAKTEIRV